MEHNGTLVCGNMDQNLWSPGGLTLTCEIQRSQKPKGMIRFPHKYRQQFNLMVSRWCRISSIHTVAFVAWYLQDHFPLVPAVRCHVSGSEGITGFKRQPLEVSITHFPSWPKTSNQTSCVPLQMVQTRKVTEVQELRK